MDKIARDMRKRREARTLERLETERKTKKRRKEEQEIALIMSFFDD